MSAGYSKTPLWKKLGYKPGSRVWVSGEPASFWDDLGPLPEGVKLLKRLTADLDMIHFFSADREALAKQLPRFQKQLKSSGMIWISWPKKASKVPSTITEGTIRQIALPMGLVDVKVCAVDAVWSGLKLMIRRELR